MSSIEEEGWKADDDSHERTKFVLFMETTGLADPKPFLRVFCHEQTMLEHFELQSVICVVDSVRWQMTLKEDATKLVVEGSGTNPFFAVLDGKNPNKSINSSGGMQNGPSSTATAIPSTSSSSSLVSRGIEQLRVADVVVVNGFSTVNSLSKDLDKWLSSHVSTTSTPPHNCTTSSDGVISTGTMGGRGRISPQIVFWRGASSSTFIRTDDEDPEVEEYLSTKILNFNKPNDSMEQEHDEQHETETSGAGVENKNGDRRAAQHCEDSSCVLNQVEVASPFSTATFTQQLFKIGGTSSTTSTGGNLRGMNHDRTFETACVFGDDNTTLDFDKHAALLLARLSEGDLFRVQGWFSFEDTNSSSLTNSSTNSSTTPSEGASLL